MRPAHADACASILLTLSATDITARARSESPPRVLRINKQQTSNPFPRLTSHDKNKLSIPKSPSPCLEQLHHNHLLDSNSQTSTSIANPAHTPSLSIQTAHGRKSQRRAICCLQGTTGNMVRHDRRPLPGNNESVAFVSTSHVRTGMKQGYQCESWFVCSPTS